MEEKILQQLTAYLLDGQRHSIRIYGHGASGKSTFAQKLYQVLDEKEANLLETDAYILPQSSRSLVVPKESPDQPVTASLPAAHELESLERDVRALQSGLDILTIGQAWSPSRRLSARKPILVVEGMAAAFLPEALFDLSICFCTDSETELARRLARDTAVRQRDPDWVRAAHQARREQNQAYYKIYEKKADILVNQTEGFRLEKNLWAD